MVCYKKSRLVVVGSLFSALSLLPSRSLLRLVELRVDGVVGEHERLARLLFKAIELAGRSVKEIYSEWVYLNGAALGRPDGGHAEHARAGHARAAPHLALEGGELARDALLRLEGVLEVALGLASLRLLAANLFLGLVELAFQLL